MSDNPLRAALDDLAREVSEARASGSVARRQWAVGVDYAEYRVRAALAASATDERPLLHDCAHCRNVRKLAASATDEFNARAILREQRRCIPPHGSLEDLLDGDATVEEHRAALAATATDEPKPRSDEWLDGYEAGQRDAGRNADLAREHAASATDVDARLLANAILGGSSDKLHREAAERILAASATEGHPFKDEWAFQRSMPEPYPGNSVAGKPIAPTQPCFDCDVPFKDHALAATATGTLRAAQREVVREWFDAGHETGRMEYDVLLDRLAALAASATDEPDHCPDCAGGLYCPGIAR